VTRHACLAAFALSLFAAAAAPALDVPHEGDPAPAFTLARASGGTISLSDFKGKPLYLNFFASWCGPCNAEAPSVGKLYAKYHSKGFTVVGINELENKTKALAFAQQYKWPFAIAVDDGSMGGSYGIVGLPVHIFIDKHGNVSTFRLGEMDPHEIEAAIKKIL
jgi:cytochrome c biogenesis protein CcmG/thiol:disulfide interchange protein DsbE